ncbi:MAG: DUF4881 domain-containing protein [Nitrospira sp.]|nr:DUF4881 domain-containing protein [Nitrospira sp.]
MRYAMIKKIGLFAVLSVLSLSLAVGCGELGKVDQGRVVDYDKEKGVFTIISDKNYEDPKNPDYTILPPRIYEVPKVFAEMGAEPKPGYRMKLDTKKGDITVFDPATQNFKTIHYNRIDHKENVDPKDPLVYDKAADKAKKFPVVDREKKTITIYSKRLKALETFTVADEYFALPDKTWDSGDEVRIYYKQEGKALRVMNISKTDIYKK